MSIFSGIFLLLLGCHSVCSARMTLKNLHCQSLDSKYITVELCELIPKGNVFKAFVNNTWDGCKLMKNLIKQSSVFYRLYNYIRPYTNMNHPCPFNESIYVKNFSLYGQRPLIPMPNGNYNANILFGIDGNDRFRVNFIFNVAN
ncbi:uncharacterized protein LOC142225192 [Haematobia irritans]|uniref:uncharacterized protein LOC142225192 n=1 Tax=Haematobia irritans TaxID=7368 RepID=UPI003F5034A5